MLAARARLWALTLTLLAAVLTFAGAGDAFASTATSPAAKARIRLCRAHHGQHCGASKSRAVGDAHATVAFTQAPAPSSTATVATFAWAISSAHRTVRCRLDGGAWSACQSGRSYAGLAVGTHSFDLRIWSGRSFAVGHDSWSVTAPQTSPAPTPAPAPAPTPTTPAPTPTTPAPTPTTPAPTPTTPAPTPTTPAPTPTTPSSTTTTPGSTSSPSGSSTANTMGRHIFGIAAGSTLQNEFGTPTMARDLDLFHDAGANWTRIDINWAQIQYAGPNTYYWTNIDNAVKAAEARGMSVLGTIVYSPNWAVPAGKDSTYSPNTALYAAFAAKAAQHYAALGVQDFEIWNEPNQIGAWTPKPNVADYTTLLKAAYASIKAVDPSATVISGGLSPAATDGTNISPVDFLKGIYADGGKGSFDAVGMHPYCNPDLPGQADSWSAWYQMYGTPTSLRSLMVANGDGDLKIWGTEFGTPSAGLSGLSPTFQAQTVTLAYQLWSTYSWAGPLFFYEGRNNGDNANSTWDNYGFAGTDFSLKPSYYAYQSAAASA